MSGIEEELEYMSSAIDSINDNVNELNQNNNGSFSGIGLIIVIILICINRNIIRLTQVIKDKNS